MSVVCSAYRFLFPAFPVSLFANVRGSRVYIKYGRVSSHEEKLGGKRGAHHEKEGFAETRICVARIFLQRGRRENPGAGRLARTDALSPPRFDHASRPRSCRGVQVEETF